VTDWLATVSELATGAGTLVLAVATFASVRSANRAARTAEQSMLAGMRPVMMNSRLQDPRQKIMFSDGRWVAVPGGGAVVEATETAIYLAVSLRNAGTGMGILHGWQLIPHWETTTIRCPPPQNFTPQTRDMYVASADLGFWQGALRDPDARLFKEATAAIEARETMMLDLLYGDFEGGQRVVSRFTLAHSPYGPQSHGESMSGRDGDSPDPLSTADPADPARRPEPERWIASVVRHWPIDQPDPHPDLDPPSQDAQ
jgi:hypothetical protein